MYHLIVAIIIIYQKLFTKKCCDDYDKYDFNNRLNVYISLRNYAMF